jgi:hypothetical protein
MGLIFVNVTSDQIEKEARIKSLNHFEFFFLSRGLCVGTIAQPPPASQKTTSSSSTNRGVPVLALSTIPYSRAYAAPNGTLSRHHARVVATFEVSLWRSTVPAWRKLQQDAFPRKAAAQQRYRHSG